MRLKKYSYTEFVDTPKEWILEPLDLQQLNLIVGINSTGKSRTLNTISSLSKMLNGGPVLSGGDFIAEFEHDNQEWRYELYTKDQLVTKEILTRNDQTLLQRGEGGEGKIWAEELNRDLKFQTPQSQVAAYSRYDTIQHAFLGPLVKWADQTYHFHFGGHTLGKNNLLLPVSGIETEINFKDETQTIQIFREGMKRFSGRFQTSILKSMNRVGYKINSVDVGHATQLRIQGWGDAKVETLRVKEDGINTYVEQQFMSDGMFSALAIIIHLTYGLLSQSPECILLDDIGQGLDFERSSALIEVLVEEITESQAQIIMTSNDRFIMNAMNLDYWTVLVRDKTTVRPFNKFNSPEKFKDFKFTGLSNFDFFSQSYVTRH
ncbi:AAA family ATPase [Sinorhizobium sp. BG8]|uniref:AAA family ATPase n=1 Tax=Sinorhizobium sp. BG8 TaxID=2613773 RepID=UPI00193D9663|nr:AAA family ATPase [Sinorhizobium sp. BG8]QRM55311.1 ATP-binding protein [Sinorhizobium sp. BG8]